MKHANELQKISTQAFIKFRKKYFSISDQNVISIQEKLQFPQNCILSYILFDKTTELKHRKPVRATIGQFTGVAKCGIQCSTSTRLLSQHSSIYSLVSTSWKCFSNYREMPAGRVCHTTKCLNGHLFLFILQLMNMILHCSVSCNSCMYFHGSWNPYKASDVIREDALSSHELLRWLAFLTSPNTYKRYIF